MSISRSPVAPLTPRIPLPTTSRVRPQPLPRQRSPEQQVPQLRRVLQGLRQLRRAGRAEVAEPARPVRARPLERPPRKDPGLVRRPYGPLAPRDPWPLPSPTRREPHPQTRGTWSGGPPRHPRPLLTPARGPPHPLTRHHTATAESPAPAWHDRDSLKVSRAGIEPAANRMRSQKRTTQAKAGGGPTPTSPSPS